MAQSIKLGNDLFLDASGVDGIKAVLTSGDLNDYYGVHKSGVYHLNATASAFSNCPQGYSVLFVYSGNLGFGAQMIYSRSGIWYRDRSGSPVNWSDWFKVVRQKESDTINMSDYTIQSGETASFVLSSGSRIYLSFVGFNSSAVGACGVGANSSGQTYAYWNPRASSIDITTGTNGSLTIKNNSSVLVTAFALGNGEMKKS